MHKNIIGQNFYLHPQVENFWFGLARFLHTADLKASAFHCQIDCQISFDNYHLNFKDAETRQLFKFDSLFDKPRQQMSRKLITKMSFWQFHSIQRCHS
jgi:hypothetical protein